MSGIKKIKKLVRKEILDLPVYAAGKSIREAGRNSKAGNIIKLASNENPLGPSPSVLKAIKRAGENVNFYPDAGCMDLREAVAKRLSVDGSKLVFANGSGGVINLIALAFLNSGDEVVMGMPTFIYYPIIAKLMGCRVVGVPLKNYRHDLSKMLEAVNRKTKLVLIANPHNPTGTMISRKELESFLREIPARVLVILDEAYFDYATDPDYPNGLDYLRRYPNLIILRTFSKIYALGGLRVSYGVASPDIAGCLQRVSPPFLVNSLAQSAAIAALNDRAHYKKSLEVNEEGKYFLYKAFESLGLQYVRTEANFILIELPSESGPVSEGLLRAGVIVRDGAVFGYKRNIRVSIGTPTQNRRFVKTLKNVLAIG